MKAFHSKTTSVLLGSVLFGLLLGGCNSNDNNANTSTPTQDQQEKVGANLGPRPLFLVNDMDEGPLKDKLAQCSQGPFYRTDFSIGHRGASMQFPEHTKEAYLAAIDAGAGIVECDVTFTADKQLVCRHSQCDLATTTNILGIPELAAKCRQPFSPADAANGVNASAECCTSDITLDEFKQLCGKMDGFNPKATTAETFMKGTPDWRTDLYASCGTLMTHAESIALFKEARVKMTPELKAASVPMPFDGFSQQDYAQKMIDEYQAAGVPAKDVYPQSFNLEDVQYWLANNADFGKQAVYLDDRYDSDSSFNPNDLTHWQADMQRLKALGVEIIAPPLWVLVALDDSGKIVPSAYALAAKEAGLKIITWSLERSGPLAQGGGWYYQSISDGINNDGDVYQLLDVLAKEVEVLGVFSDWPATVTYYANCMDI
ncbi:glycerophosphodiester phosphodiesterase family protein [Shewanella algae]|uniref:glycerophosphodiester phosphodiesterase family protein n=1 Tax=Shewanella algae TaxID=38313 RepID=UPI003005009F